MFNFNNKKKKEQELLEIEKKDITFQIKNFIYNFYITKEKLYFICDVKITIDKDFILVTIFSTKPSILIGIKGSTIKNLSNYITSKFIAKNNKKYRIKTEIKQNELWDDIT